MCSGFNNDYKSSEPLKTLVRPKLFYVYTFYTYWTFGALKLFNIVVNKVNKETYVRLSSIFLKPESKESLIWCLNSWRNQNQSSILGARVCV